MKTIFIHLLCLNGWRPHTRLVNSQIPVTLMVAPACERETDIKGKKIRKKLQVTKQPHIKNIFRSFHKAISWAMNTNHKYLLHTTPNFRFPFSFTTSSTIKCHTKPTQVHSNGISIQTLLFCGTLESPFLTKKIYLQYLFLFFQCMDCKESWIFTLYK